MDANIVKAAHALKEKTISRRRDFHKYAEAAWTEFRTASIVAKTLQGLGFRTLVGEEVVDGSAMMGVPAPTELERQVERALAQGGDKVGTAKHGQLHAGAALLHLQGSAIHIPRACLKQPLAHVGQQFGS